MALTAKFALFGHEGYALSASWVASSEQTTYPNGNLQLGTYAAPWRSALGALSSIILTFDLGAAKAVGGVGLAGVNLGLSATRRVELSANAGFSPLVADSGTSSAFNTSLPVLQGRNGTWRAPWGRNLLYFPPAEVSARYGRITLTDAGNPDNYLAAAIPVVGQLWQPGINFLGGSWSAADERMSEAGSGGLLRGHKLTFHRLTRAERSQVHSLARALGMTGRIMVVPEPTRAETWLGDAIYARFEDLIESTGVDNTGQWWTVQVVFREVDR